MEGLRNLVLLIVGGGLVALQVFVGILGLSHRPLLRPGARGWWNQVKVMAAGFGLAIPPLVIGGWLSDAHPLVTIGRTMLIAAALGCIGFAFLLIPLPEDDEDYVPRVDLDLLPGWVNLLLVVGAGLILFNYGSELL